MDDFDKAKQQLVDLREKISDEGAQNLILGKQIPRENSGKSLENAKLDAHEFKAYEYGSLDAAICVLRHLFAHIGAEWREGNDNNPLESMVWADLNESSGPAQSCVRYHILKHLRTLGGNVTLNYEQIMENKTMFETVWVRDAFMLWHRAVYERRYGSKIWTQVEFKKLPKLAELSKIKYNGKGDLGELISSKFGRENMEEEELDLHWQSNSPSIIRVLYDNTESESMTRSFNELARITVDGQRLDEEVDDQGRTRLLLKPGVKDTIKYQLIASVRLGNSYDQKDRIRLYRIDGEPIRHTATLLGRFAGVKWNIGDNARFMLYYAQELPNRPSGGREPPEIAGDTHPYLGAMRREMVNFSSPSASHGQSSRSQEGEIRQYDTWRSTLSRR